MKQPSIVVVGSANTDITVPADRLPGPGETVLGGDFALAGGGKGANQAVAAARAGARVTFVGRVGADDFGAATRRRLAAEGIDLTYLRTDEHAPSGIALIIVDGAGENLIAVSPGANGRVGTADVEAARPAIEGADLVLLQLEIPLEAVTAAAAAARSAHVPVMLNPAPARPLPDGLLASLGYVTPNAGEAARLTGLDAAAPPEELARALVAAGAGAAVLTLGARGACACDGRACWRVAAPAVRAVDTVGAGDCFSGVLAVALAEGRALRQAVEFACCAAAISVQRAGAQPSLPRRDEIDLLTAHHTTRRAS